MTAILVLIGVLVGALSGLGSAWLLANRVLAKLDWAMRKVDDNKRISEGWYLKLERRVVRIEQACPACKTQLTG